MARRRRSPWGWGYQPTSAGEIAYSANKTLENAKKKGLEYHPVVISGTRIVKTWWGISWCENLERYADYSNRLPRGRTYVRSGAVVDLTLDKGAAHAKVRGTSLYTVDIRFDPLSAKKEKELGKLCSDNIQNIEELLSGHFPEMLKEQITARGALFPAPQEIHFKCSCPDWASMCKHVAAAMYGIGLRLDEDPMGFFVLRGLDPNKFIARAVESRVSLMLKNAKKKSTRIIDDQDVDALFGVF